MRRIYASAEKVLLWTGEAKYWTFEAFEIFDKIYNQYITTYLKPMDGSYIQRLADASVEHGIDGADMARVFDEFVFEGWDFAGMTVPSLPNLVEELGLPLWIPPWRGVVEFFTRPVFRRVWIIQEICVARKVLIVCGGFEIPWAIASTIASLVIKTCWALNNQGLFLMLDRDIGLDTLGAIDHLRRRRVCYHLGWTDSLWNSMGQISLPVEFEATDPRDKVYGILGILKRTSKTVSRYWFQTTEKKSRRYSETSQEPS